MPRETPRLRLPRPVSPGQPVRAADYNLLLAAFRQLQAEVSARTPQPSADIGHRYGPGGFSAFLKRKARGGGGASQPLLASISPVPDSDPVQYAVTVTPGFLLYQNAGAAESDQGATGWIAPTMGGKALDDDEKPRLTLPALASWVYLRVRTDQDGVPKFEPGGCTIEAFPSAKKSVHHVRDNPSSGGEEGDYYLLLLQTESDGGSPARPRIVRRIAGHREMPNQLIEIKNIGGKREIYSGYQPGAADHHELRTLEDLEGAGVPVLKELDPGSPAEPPVVSPDGQVLSPGKPAVPPEKEAATLKLRRIAPGEREQIKVRKSGDGSRIVVEGNGFLMGDDDADVFSFRFDDGLCTEFAPKPHVGWWGTVIFQSGGGTPFGRKDYERGRLMRVYSWGSGNQWVLQSGTEQAPGNVVIITETA